MTGSPAPGARQAGTRPALGSIVAEGHVANSLFAARNVVHRHYPNRMHIALRETFAAAGIELNTADLNAGRKVDFELHLEARPLVDDGMPRFLVALENPYINPLNADPSRLAGYLRVFTWNPQLFGLGNVVPIRVPNRIEPDLPFATFAERRRFACLINANKLFRTPVPGDLYGERLRTVHWYERHHPESFDLWGLGWGKPPPAFDLWGRLRRALQRAAQAGGWKPFPSWRGEADDKAAVYRSTRFAICYENTSSLPDYITEKIFDALVYGCVPVYWGPANVADRIPPECFIDRRRFRDTAALHEHLLGIDAARYALYQRTIAEWLGGEGARPFGDRAYADTIVGTIVALTGVPGHGARQ